MFERYTEKARRTIFFARYEASQFGSPYIDSEHLLLGLLREDKALAKRFFHSQGSIETIRARIEKHAPAGEKISVSLDLPLSDECKRILTHAADEAESLGHRHIGTEHLFLGILREEKCFAATLLQEREITLSGVREEMKNTPVEKKSAAASAKDAVLPEFSADLTESAAENQFDPLIGREAELDRVMHILALRSRNNPVLIGEPGVGKAALVKGLAQHIADGRVSSHFADKRILALDISSVLAGARQSGRLEERLKAITEEAIGAGNVILFIEELFAPGSAEALNLLRPVLTRRELQCIAAATPEDYAKSIDKEHWLEQCFQDVKVPPPGPDNAIRIMFGIKERYEKFHGVAYTDEALKCAVHYSEKYLTSRQLPDKAIDLIDEAGASAKLRVANLPEEVVDVQKRLKFVVHRMEVSIANHEFEKARFYSDEERKERENLKQLREKYKIEETEGGATVTRQDIEAAVARIAGVPVATIRQEGLPQDSENAKNGT